MVQIPCETLAFAVWVLLKLGSPQFQRIIPVYPSVFHMFTGFCYMGFSIVMGVTPTAGWFLSLTIPSRNGWFGTQSSTIIAAWWGDRKASAHVARGNAYVLRWCCRGIHGMGYECRSWGYTMGTKDLWLLGIKCGITCRTIIYWWIVLWAQVVTSLEWWLGPRGISPKWLKMSTNFCYIQRLVNHYHI